MSIKNINYKISISIPTYNGANYIKMQLELFLNECNNLKFKNLIEMVICDNCSSDHTKNIVNCYKKKIKNKFINIKYFKQKKNLGYYKNLLKLINISKGEYILLMVDHDIPESGFYKELKDKIIFKNYNSLIFLPIKNIETYKPKLFELNKLGYICDRGSKLSGVIMKRDKISLKYVENSLYVQNIIYIDYYLRFGLKEIPFQHKILEKGTSQLVNEKFKDRMKRKNDYALNDKLRSVEIFYLNNKISYLKYVLTILKIYNWCLEIAWQLRMENKFLLQKNLFFKIIKNKNMTPTIFILFLIKNIFNKKIYYQFKNSFN
jgi:glycosyltransferase involved in cell wall biosynthesis